MMINKYKDDDDDGIITDFAALARKNPQFEISCPCLSLDLIVRLKFSKILFIPGPTLYVILEYFVLSKIFLSNYLKPARIKYFQKIYFFINCLKK